MNPYGLALLVVCLQTVSSVWDHEFLTNFLRPIGKIVQAQELLWFISEILTTNNSENLQEFMVKTHNAMGLTQIVLTNRTDLRIIEATTRKNAFSVILTTGPDDPVMNMHDIVLRRRHMYFSLIVMVNEIHDFRVVERFLADMYTRNFDNSIVYFQQNGKNGMYGYNLYPEFNIEDRMDFFGYLMRMVKYLNGNMDTQGYVMNTPLRQDLPAVFKYRIGANNRTLFEGTAYNLIKLFTEYTNASLVSYAMPPDSLGGEVIDMRAALELIRERKVAVMTHAYALFEIDDQIDKSYPIMVVRWCLMVPIFNTVSTFYYALQPFDVWTWYAMVCTFFGLALTDTLWVLWRHSRGLTKRQLLLLIYDCFSYNFCFLINIVAPKIIRTPNTLRFIFFIALFFYGFFISANYTSLLGSILTVTLFRGQINTMEDLISANISVMIIDYEYEFLLSGGNDLPANFHKLLRPVDAATFSQHQVSLNKSFAYFVTDERWHFLNLQQKYLKERLFKFTDICFGSYHLAFPMQTDNSLWRSIEYYIFRMHSSGMIQYYESISFDYAVRAGLVQRLTDPTTYSSAGMDHLMMIFILLAGMLGVSFVIFIGEVLIYWLTRRKTKQNNGEQRVMRSLH